MFYRFGCAEREKEIDNLNSEMIYVWRTDRQIFVRAFYTFVAQYMLALV